MALATRCPHCGTVFKVASDQLKLRGGLVRCGVCQQVFNGVEGLVKNEQPATPEAPSGPSAATPDAAAPGSSAPASLPASPHGTPGNSITGTAVPHGGSLLIRPAANDAPAGTSRQAPPIHAASAVSSPPGAQTRRPPSDPGNRTTPGNGDRPAPLDGARERGEEAAQPAPDPMLRMTLLDIAQAGQVPLHSPGGVPVPAPVPARPAGQDGSDLPTDPSSDATTPDPLAAAIDELNARPVTGSMPLTQQDEEDRAIDPDLPEPSFLSTRKPSRLAIFWKTGVALLAVLMALQLFYLARHRITGAVPQIGAVIESLCTVLHCDAGLPAEIDAVSIESSELQQPPGGLPVFSLSFTLQNTSDTAQSWPHVELTLNDAADLPVVRRVFTPDEYGVSAAQRKQGLARQDSASFRLTFELSQQKAAGYRIYVFYP